MGGSSVSAMPPTLPEVFGITNGRVVALVERAAVVVAGGGLVRVVVGAGGRVVAADAGLVEAGTVVARLVLLAVVVGGRVVSGAARVEVLLADGASGAAAAGVGPGVIAE